MLSLPFSSVSISYAFYLDGVTSILCTTPPANYPTVGTSNSLNNVLKLLLIANTEFSPVAINCWKSIVGVCSFKPNESNNYIKSSNVLILSAIKRISILVSF